MAIPTYDQLKSNVLQIMKDGNVRSVGELTDIVSKQLSLSTEDLEKLLPSGTQTVIHSRTSWACTYLKQAGLLDRPERAKLVITERGQLALLETGGQIDNSYLRKYPEFVEFMRRSNEKQTTPIDQIQSELSPEEQLDSAALSLQQSLADDLLDKLKTVSPAFFERIVVDLLVAMGYGGSVKDAGKSVGKSGDGGIDGIIKEDKLGLDTIYIQAKRWEANVGRPEVQKFAGALQGVRARKGVFITTSSYSSDALDFVRNIDSKIVLIDGAELSRLMIEYGVGVSVQRVVKVMRLDGDYFEE
jgi:restriction system protein